MRGPAPEQKAQPDPKPIQKAVQKKLFPPKKKY
jgi:hypothetical protein